LPRRTEYGEQRRIMKQFVLASGPAVDALIQPREKSLRQAQLNHNKNNWPKNVFWERQSFLEMSPRVCLFGIFLCAHLSVASISIVFLHPPVFGARSAHKYADRRRPCIINDRTSHLIPRPLTTAATPITRNSESNAARWKNNI
jgi:hypothetical protein